MQVPAQAAAETAFVVVVGVMVLGRHQIALRGRAHRPIGTRHALLDLTTKRHDFTAKTRRNQNAESI